jgi:hypothetical protein
MGKTGKSTACTLAYADEPCTFGSDPEYTAVANQNQFVSSHGTLRSVYKQRQPHFHIISQSQLVDQRRSIISEEASCFGENTATACQRVEWHPGIHWQPKPPENVAVESSYEGALWSYNV